MAKKWFSIMAVMVVLSMLLTACGADPTATVVQPTATTAVAAPTATTATAAATATKAVAAPTATKATSAATATTVMTGSTTPGGSMDLSKVGPELAAAYTGAYKGTKVSMYGPFTTDDEVKFNNSMKDFETATGIDIQYQGDKEFETTINVRVEGGSPPDIADFPQPGLMASIAASGKVQDANKMINPDWLKQNYNQGYLDTATVDTPNGKILGGIFQRVNAKGLVFYPKQAFDAAGYKEPTTWAELQALMDQIVKDGDTPWCIGIESGTATGWPATDWTEQMMLRTTSLDNYDKWVAGTLPFTDPIVKNAVQKWSDIWFNDQYVYGGRNQIVTTNFGDAPKPMFTDPPKCWLMDQGNFITSFFESIKPGVKGGVDYDFFQLPALDSQYGAPVEFGGDLMAAFNDRPEVRAVMQFFSTFEGVHGWVSAGGAIAPQKDSDMSAYTNPFDRKVAEVLVNASAVRFDASDLMPGAVGSGTFWKGMTDYVSGSVDLDQALEEAQAGWANVKK
ncbi:MAG TPA: ABC transporter substrate-binding protein [Chloroflexia bacterium]|nr:ABC transporter substrate-binding protein [Chloroflexia bacterium]